MAIQLKTDGENIVVQEVTIEAQGVTLVGYINKCDHASEEAGVTQWHSAIEFWDVRTPDAPKYLHRAVLSPMDQFHRAEPEARVLVVAVFPYYVSQGSSPDLEPGEFVKILIDMNEAEETPSALAALLLRVLALEAMATEADADDDGNDDMPDVFADFLETLL